MEEEKLLEETAQILEENTSVVEAVQNVGTEAVKTAGTFITWIKSFITWENLFKVIGAVIVILLIYSIYKLCIRTIRKTPVEKLPAQRAMALTKGVQYVFYLIVIMYVLSLFGVKLSAVWGAAGVAGVALAFAAQTSVSNIISGIFIVAEKTMKPGDLITVGSETGVVDIVGLLSVQIHTLDNQLIRIPNSTIINSNMVNTSFFEKRRMTISVDVSYDTDMEYALKAIQKVPAYCKTVLKDPAPAAWFEGFGESGIKLTLAVWFTSADFLTTKNDVFIAIKKVFDEAKIEIPYNKIDVNFPAAKPASKTAVKPAPKKAKRK